jgi:dephospho-CoA kinase
MKVIGLTGGIGTGKTTIAKCFSLLGVPIFNSDTTAKKLYDKLEIVSAVTEILGNTILEENGKINKLKMAEIIFNDNEKLNLIHQLIHPLVRKKFQEFCVSNYSAAYVIKEAAILFESGSYKDCTKILSVHSPLELRVERIKKRDGNTKEEILSRIAKQWPPEKISELSDIVILNDEKELIFPKIIEINKKLNKDYN